MLELLKKRRSIRKFTEETVSPENIDRLIGMREQYGVTGKHPGYKKYL